MTGITYQDYIADIIQAIQDIKAFTSTLSFEEFINDKKTVNATIRSLEIIGEAARNIPDSLQSEYPDIPWKKMIEMRNKLIHAYFGVDLKIVWETVRNDCIPLLPMLEKMNR